MSQKSTEPWSPRAAELLAAERQIRPMPEVVRARALQRALRTSSAEKRPTVNEGARPLRLWLMAPLAIGLTALAMGAFAKWQSQRVLTSPSVQSEPVKPAPSQPAPSISHAAPDSPAPSSVQQSLTASPALGSTAVRRGDLRSQELALLDVARAATMAGDSTTALAQIREHEQRFPRGSLVEEREVLKIRALFQAGRKNEAVRAAERMRKRFPRSALLPSVDQMLRNAE